jgi:Secretion system C-terminal sorting domain
MKGSSTIINCERLLISVLLTLSVLCPTSRDTSAQSTYTWKSVIAGGGGFVPGIVYSQTVPGLIYARTDMGGAYRWDASAGRWTPLTDSMTRNNSDYMGILSIALDGSNSDRIYMETGKYTQSWAGNGALLSSTDRGNSWTINPLPMKVGGNEDGRGCGERLQVDPNADSILFMGTSSYSSTSPFQAGLWKSSDYGASWSSVSSFTPVSVNFVLFDPLSSTPGNPTQRIFAAAVNTTMQSLYESTDAGTTWNVVPGQPNGLMAIRAAIADSLLYITFSNYQGPNGATTGSVWKYNINNGSWTNITPSTSGTGSHGFSGISLFPKDPDYIIVSTLDQWSPRDEVYLSTNGGTSWTGRLLNSKLDHSYAPYTSTVNPHWLGCVAMDPFDSSKAMFGTGFGIWACDNLFASTPTWYFRDENLEETVPMQLISPPFTNLLSAMGDYDGFRHDDLNASPIRGRFSPNKGTTLSIAFAGKVPSSIVKAYNSSPYGAYSTDGGTTWKDFSRQPSGTTQGGQWAIAISADGNTIVWAPPGVSTPSYSTDNGKTWTSTSGGAPALPPIADRVNPNKFYIYNGTYYGQLWVSIDAGKTFSKALQNLPSVPSYQSQDGNLTATPDQDGDLWLCCGDGGLYRSTNSGSSASKISSVQSAYLMGFGRSVIAGGYPAIYLWGKVDGALGIFRSIDTGSTWTRINTDAQQFGYLHQVTGDPRVYGRCYISAEGRGIFYGQPPNSDTTNNPTTFRFSPAPSDSLRHFYQNITVSWSKASDMLGDSLIYILHFIGPGVDSQFVTSDSTAKFSVGSINSLSRYVLTGYVTNGFDTTASSNSISFVTASEITAVSRPETGSTDFFLNQNFPNPFNPTTTISYQIPSAGRVTLKIYNDLGEEITTLVNSVEKPGLHEVRLDARKLASGIYFYTLRVGSFVQTNKLLLLK